MEKTMNSEKYFVALVKSGHVGRKYYYEARFPVIAKSRKDAAGKCQTLARAKKGQKGMVISIDEITHEEYTIICEEEKRNPYKYCKNIQEQRKYMDEIQMQIKLDPLYKDKDEERKKKKEKGTANNKRRYANRYADTYFDWIEDLYYGIA